MNLKRLQALRAKVQGVPKESLSEDDITQIIDIFPTLLDRLEELERSDNILDGAICMLPTFDPNEDAGGDTPHEQCTARLVAAIDRLQLESK